MITYTLEEAERIFLGADPHYGHYNIIRYCHRPFKTVWEMNDTMMRNWNDTVKPEDLVYFLGDLCYGRYCLHPLEYLNKLNGQWVFIEGSHDRMMPKCLMKPYEIISVDGLELLLIHNYQDAPKDWGGWIVHGHNHQKRSFFHPYRKKVNVSVEMTDYKPVSLARIVELIKNGEGK